LYPCFFPRHYPCAFPPLPLEPFAGFPAGLLSPVSVRCRGPSPPPQLWGCFLSLGFAGLPLTGGSFPNLLRWIFNVPLTKFLLFVFATGFCCLFPGAFLLCQTLTHRPLAALVPPGSRRAFSFLFTVAVSPLKGVGVFSHPPPNGPPCRWPTTPPPPPRLQSRGHSVFSL